MQLYHRESEMAKKVKIKEIAEMAGVSAGTVDRILHNRGKVSAQSREAVEKVLAEVGYKYNIHLSAMSFRKEINIHICIPTANAGEYWGSVKNGIEHALEEYQDIDIKPHYFFYDQYDVYSCKTAYNKVGSQKADAVIIGSTFTKEALSLCEQLDKTSTPYVFVDSIVEGAHPYETYTTDQYTCGYLLAKLLDAATPIGNSIAIFRFQRIGNQGASNSCERRRGFDAYMNEMHKSGRLIETNLPATDQAQIESALLKFLARHPDVKGIAVLNSRGSILADALHKNGIKDIQIISFDLTSSNRRCLENGQIAVLLCQRPELQGFNAVKSIINKLLYNLPAQHVHHLMPVDVVFKENLPFYKEV